MKSAQTNERSRTIYRKEKEKKKEERKRKKAIPWLKKDGLIENKINMFFFKEFSKREVNHNIHKTNKEL